MFLSASALVLILSAPALAAPHDQGGGPGGGHDGGGHGGGGHPAAAAAPAGPAGGAAHGGGGHHGGGGAGGANILGGGGMSGPSHTPAGNTATPHARGGHGNSARTLPGSDGSNRGGHDSRTHAGRGHNSAFDALRRAFNAPRHYHYRGGSYRQPAGWRYQRWTTGAFLPSLYWSNSYWINDYNDYGLDNPPPGTVWVRYGDDALLIDRDSGEVVQVIYGIFY
jgi:Ni/Co efflux regulator RcnB